MAVVEPCRHADRRFDILITGLARRLAIDVAIIHTTCASRVAAAARNPGEATSIKEQQKLGIPEHARLAELEQARLVPFVVETYGHMGPGAIEILSHIAAVGEHLEYGFHDLVAMVSVSIQLGNAKLLQCGQIEAERAGRRGR